MRCVAPRRRLGLAWIAAAALAARPASGTVLPDRENAWIRVETAHFTLFGNAGAVRTREIGLELEKLRSVLSLLAPSAHGAPVPTLVFVFKSDAAIAPYKPLYLGKPTGAAGFFEGTSEGNFIALTASWSSDPRPVVYHEFLHYFLHSNFPPLPLWYEEGLADFYSTFRATSSAAEVGLPVERHVACLMREAMMPLDRLFAVSRDSPEYNERSRQGIFYAESWALVHYLTEGAPRRAPQLSRYVRLLEQGAPWERAFRDAFGVDEAVLQGELSRYVRQLSFPYRRFAYKDLSLPTRTATSPIGYGETLCRLGDLAAHGSPERLPDAEAHFEAALALDSGSAAALGGLGLIRLRQERVEEAQELLDRALAAGSRDFRVSFQLGQLQMRPLAGQPFVPGHLDLARRARVARAREAFCQAIEENPAFAQGRAELGRTYLFETGTAVSEGIAQLELAAAALPSRTDLLVDLAELYDRRGDRARHAELLRQALGAEAENVLTQRRSREELEASLTRVRALLEGGQDEAAVTLLEEIAASAPPGDAAWLSSELESLRRQSALNRVIRQYNEAVAQYNHRELAAALAGFESVAATTLDAELAQTAREQARWVRHLMTQAQPRKTPAAGRP
jgi:tetratricopeptide (TPR) repeat protein